MHSAAFLTDSLKDAVVMLLKGNFAKGVHRDIILMDIVMEPTICFSGFFFVIRS